MDCDEDGFYVGECNGLRGLVPSNMVSPLKLDWPKNTKSISTSQHSMQQPQQQSRQKQFVPHAGLNMTNPNEINQTKLNQMSFQNKQSHPSSNNPNMVRDLKSYSPKPPNMQFQHKNVI